MGLETVDEIRGDPAAFAVAWSEVLDRCGAAPDSGVVSIARASRAPGPAGSRAGRSFAALREEVPPERVPSSPFGCRLCSDGVQRWLALLIRS